MVTGTTTGVVPTLPSTTDSMDGAWKVTTCVGAAAGALERRVGSHKLGPAANPPT
jgi:hypothetical protein